MSTSRGQRWPTALPKAPKQIAEALEAAHEAGVIHRDLKPANIKVRDDGTVKVLDFGLAKALDTAPDGDPSQSPTLTAAATQMGVIMGTAAYMSPEQARGKPVDKRADIWAFGAVLYEMLTGKRAFVGEDVSDTLAAVLRAEVELDRLPSEIPARLRRVITACLQRDPKERVHDMADVRLAMEGAFETPRVGTTSTAAVASRPQVLGSPVALLLGALAVAVVTGVVVWGLRSSACVRWAGRRAGWDDARDACVGPDTEWRRGTVVVSEGGLLTQAEMDYWNFFAKRVGEPFHTMGSPGYPSFYESLDGRMRLRTDVAPKDHPALAWAEPTALRDYAPTAWRGVVFDAPVPSWFLPHEPYTFQGEVVDDAYDRIEICLWRQGSYAECQQARLPAGGRFSVPHTFGEAGDYRVSVYLYDDPHDDDDRDSAAAGVSGFVVGPGVPCLERAGPARVSLQAHDGHYLVAAPGGVVNATSATPGPWETFFTVVDPNGGCVASGDVVRLRTSSGSYLQAVNGGGGVMDAAGTAAGPWGAFRITRAQGTGPLRTLDEVRLQAPNGQYVVAENGGGGVVNATSATPGPWETFTLWSRP